VVAIIVREVRDQFRLEKMLVVVGPAVFTAFLAILFFTNYFVPGTAFEARASAFRTFFYEVLAIQYFLLIGLGALLAAGGISSRRDRQEMDFEIITPRTGASIALGCMLGSNVFIYFLFVLTIPFTILGYYLGRIEPERLTEAYVFLLGGTLFFQAVGLYIGALVRTPTGAQVGTGMALLASAAAVLLDAPAAGAFRHFGFWSPLHVFVKGLGAHASYCMQFYGMNSPGGVNMSLIILFIFLFFGLWFFIGASRKLADNARPSLSRPGALILYASMLVLAGGFLWHKIPVSGPDAPGNQGAFYLPVLVYAACALAFAIPLYFVITPTRERYRLFLGNVLERPPSMRRVVFHADSMPFAFAALMHVAAFVVFVAVFIFFGKMGEHLGTAAGSGSPAFFFSALVAFMLVFFVASFYLAVIQLAQLSVKRYAKSTAVLAILLLVILPFVTDFALTPSAPDRQTTDGQPARSKLSFMYVLNPVTVLSQTFPEVGLKVENPIYWITGGKKPGESENSNPGLWQAVTTGVYMALSLILWGAALFIRRRVSYKVALQRGIEPPWTQSTSSS
jgi:hypothetical protein